MAIDCVGKFIELIILFFFCYVGHTVLSNKVQDGLKHSCYSVEPNHAPA